MAGSPAGTQVASAQATAQNAADVGYAQQAAARAAAGGSASSTTPGAAAQQQQQLAAAHAMVAQHALADPMGAASAQAAAQLKASRVQAPSAQTGGAGTQGLEVAHANQNAVAARAAQNVAPAPMGSPLRNLAATLASAQRGRRTSLWG